MGGGDDRNAQYITPEGHKSIIYQPITNCYFCSLNFKFIILLLFSYEHFSFTWNLIEGYSIKTSPPPSKNFKLIILVFFHISTFPVKISVFFFNLHGKLIVSYSIKRPPLPLGMLGGGEQNLPKGECQKPAAPPSPTNLDSPAGH